MLSRWKLIRWQPLNTYLLLGSSRQYVLEQCTESVKGLPYGLIKSTKTTYSSCLLNIGIRIIELPGQGGSFIDSHRQGSLGAEEFDLKHQNRVRLNSPCWESTSSISIVRSALQRQQDILLWPPPNRPEENNGCTCAPHLEEKNGWLEEVRLRNRSCHGKIGISI